MLTHCTSDLIHHRLWCAFMGLDDDFFLPRGGKEA